MALCKPTPNTIINGDCALVLKEFEAECIDLTVTSPPYDNLRDYEGYHFDFEAIAKQLFRITKQGGVVVWVVGDETINGSESGNSFRQALYFMQLGFNLHDTMIYQTNKPPLNDRRYQSAFEFMFIFSKGAPASFNPIMEKSIKYGTKSTNYSGHRGKDGIFKERSGGKFIQHPMKIKNNIWWFYVGQGKDDSIAYQHPARFPEALANDHILSWSNPGDLVLDPMCGSGTTLKMAKQTGRNYIGIDMSEKYCKLSKKRVEGAQPPLLLETGQPTTRAVDSGNGSAKNDYVSPEMFPVSEG